MVGCRWRGPGRAAAGGKGAALDGKHGALLRLILAATLSGLAIGLLGTAFRQLLTLAGALRDRLLGGLAAEAGGLGLPLTMAAVAAAVFAARWLVVRVAPMAAGSGVQHVEAVCRGEVLSSPPRVVPVKFVGGLLAIGAGLALGREGPTVQMGAAVGAIAAQRLLPDAGDGAIVDAAGAGAGLAVAFNAPLAGALFVFEELARRFTARLMLATLVAVAVAIATLRVLAGDTPDFAAGPPTPQQPAEWPLYLLLGLILGGIGAAGNWLTLALLALSDRCARMPSSARAAVIGALVGGVAWFAPAIVGGGERIIVAVLEGALPLAALAAMLVARFVIGPVSYAAGTPGGLFAPLMAVGALAGALFAGIVPLLLPSLAPSPVSFAVIGMAALFTAMVRAPLTGIAVVIEMTARPDLCLGMMAAAAAAFTVATLLGSEPIYDSLRRRMLAQSAGGRPGAGGGVTPVGGG